MFRQATDIVRAYHTGAFQMTSFRKVPSQASVSGTWVDLSMASGNPVPNFYTGVELSATTIDGNKGIYHGQGIPGMTKYLNKIQLLSTIAPINLHLCDYLLFYPQIDMDSTDTQVFDNTLLLPRYSDGDGVRMFLVAQYPYIGNVDFVVTYTNSQGVSGQSTGVIRANTAGFIASMVHGSTVQGGFGPFLPLASGDTGIQKVDSITFLSPNGGLGAIVLVKPLANISVNEITAPSETSFSQDIMSIPIIESGACLNFIGLATQSVSGAGITGQLDFIFG